MHAFSGMQGAKSVQVPRGLVKRIRNVIGVSFGWEGVTRQKLR